MSSHNLPAYLQEVKDRNENVASKIGIADAGSLFTATDVEAALAEVAQGQSTAQAFIPIGLHSLRITSTLNAGAIAAIGGVTASDSVPILSAINGATDGCQRLLWAATAVTQVTLQTPLPPDLDDAQDIVLHVRAAMGGANDTPTIAMASYFNEGDTAVADTVAAVTGAAYAEYIGTIATADVPVGAQTLTIGLTPAAHGTDTLSITALWLEYTRKILTA